MGWMLHLVLLYLQSTVMLESVNYWTKSLNSMACSKVSRNTEANITHTESCIHVLAVMFQAWEAIHNLLVPFKHLQNEWILHYWIFKIVKNKKKTSIKFPLMLDIFHHLTLVKKNEMFWNLETEIGITLCCGIQTHLFWAYINVNKNVWGHQICTKDLKFYLLILKGNY